MIAITIPASPVPELHTFELTAEHEALLQRFFVANPEYYEICYGTPAPPDEAHHEIHDDPPAEWGFTKKWLIGYAGADGELVAMANVISDLLAPRVWHIGYFMVATQRYHSGLSRVLYDGLEHWMRASGADWIRLGIIKGNTRAERFWTSLGYIETRQRERVPYGERFHTLRVCHKALAGGTPEQYFALVPRDRPDGEGA